MPSVKNKKSLRLWEGKIIKKPPQRLQPYKAILIGYQIEKYNFVLASIKRSRFDEYDLIPISVVQLRILNTGNNVCVAYLNIFGKYVGSKTEYKNIVKSHTLQAEHTSVKKIPIKLI